MELIADTLGFKFHPTFFRVAQGLAGAPINYNGIDHVHVALAPLRFIAGLVVTAVSPIFVACDLLVYIGAFIVTREIVFLKDCGRLLLVFIPTMIAFPFVFAIKPEFFGTNYLLSE